MIGDDCRATEGAAPLSIWMARTPSATRSSAFSQLTGSNAAPLRSRMSGEASQPEVSRNSGGKALAAQTAFVGREIARYNCRAIMV
ncbi:MAG TPA: hypothetical protein VLJ17_12385 [Xanthobacteraceae bacterium]|nr:hypothetical protein [Xanthobacteraceae bacterium]